MKEFIHEMLSILKLEELFRTSENCAIRVQPIRPKPLDIKKSGNRVILGEAVNADWFAHSTDLVYQPEMGFEILENGLWCPTYAKEDYRPAKKSVEYVDGCRTVRPVRNKRQTQFAERWAEKLRARDYQFGTVQHAHSW